MSDGVDSATLTDPHLGALPDAWTWIRVLTLGGLPTFDGRLVAEIAPEERERDRAVLRRREKRLWALVRVGVLEMAAEYRLRDGRVVYVPDGEPMPKWLRKEWMACGCQTCCVVRSRPQSR